MSYIIISSIIIVIIMRSGKCILVRMNMKKYNGIGKKIVIKLIRFYKTALSPYKGRSYCNYVPSCSQYAIEAIDMYGVILGGWLAFKRILRCNPFHKGGFDPVPIGKYKRKGLH